MTAAVMAQSSTKVVNNVLLTGGPHLLLLLPLFPPPPPPFPPHPMQVLDADVLHSGNRLQLSNPRHIPHEPHPRFHLHTHPHVQNGEVGLDGFEQSSQGCRDHSIDWRRLHSHNFYKGPPLSIVNVVSKYLLILLSPHSRWVLGGFFLAVEALTTSLIYIVKNCTHAHTEQQRDGQKKS
ncbi:hypothetical protein CDL15_Pgr009681 [Punica granatum]|uniref:Uncharacterized protein n=1 Tax=Punica granatum TaxID=22663 RepID=A0A218WTW4_PUNGR|nr:hypothetical protein CDL15_Pgr009681 [Punica granatum]